MLLLALLLGCTPKSSEPAPPVPAPEPEAPVAPPTLGELSTEALADLPGVTGWATSISLGGTEHPLKLRSVIQSGQEVGGSVFAAMTDAKGVPLDWPAWMQGEREGKRVCNVIDFTSLVHTEHGWFHLSHLECTVGGVAVTPIAFSGGDFTVGPPKLVDFSAVGGTTNACSGDVTPWGTHLGSEEYEANARVAGSDGRMPESEMSMATKHPFEWSFLNALADYTPEVSPWRYGWVPEIRVTKADGTARVDKRYSLGRFSHELALVMPDQRTVYLSDDQYHGVFFMFVADKKADLSAGTLYGSRWTQRGDAAADLEWISLGHATDAQIERTITEKVQFTDLFEAAPVSAEGTCPDGLTRTMHTWGAECLRAKDPVSASRLEARRYAALRGATTELTKSEGLALDPGDGTPASSRLYLATSKISTGMLEEGTPRGPAGRDYRRAPEQDHLKLPENRCGAVWRMTPGESVDRDGQAIDSAYVVRTAEIAIAGRPDGETACAEDGISNPDNLTFVDDYGWLLIAEDTTYHAHDVLWALDVREPDAKPVRLAQVDRGTEVSGIQWFHVDGQGWLTLSNQWDPESYPEKRSAAMLLGPFPLP